MDVKLNVLSVLCLLLIAVPSSVYAEESAADNKTSGKAPAFTLKDADGKDVSLSDFAGKVVVLEWANYDCPFVKAHYNDETHTMKDLSKKYKDQGVVWLTINSTHYATAEAVKVWASEQQIVNQTLLLDPDGTVGHKYHAKTTPHMFVIDKQGQIVYQGAIDNAPRGSKVDEYVNYVDQALSEVLAGKAVSVPDTKPYGCSVKYPPEAN